MLKWPCNDLNVFFAALASRIACNPAPLSFGLWGLLCYCFLGRIVYGRSALLLSCRSSTLLLGLSDEPMEVEFPKDLQHISTMPRYDAEFPSAVVFPPQNMTNVLAEWLSSKGVKQAHIAGESSLHNSPQLFPTQSALSRTQKQKNPHTSLSSSTAASSEVRARGAVHGVESQGRDVRLAGGDERIGGRGQGDGGGEETSL
ncbi:hypothetical protein DFH08DRAFT_936450 [Mycena albidolilacea]|uniref:Uncharacterized protein n=1 Tax=Mycena albidolilacea TaxID=1033008 RepID=A0AAD7A3Z8_9AGAR|nr:hypothetical protein DFH08DRAFT_936450 [Mycena albidolilacea]